MSKVIYELNPDGTKEPIIPIIVQPTISPDSDNILYEKDNGLKVDKREVAFYYLAVANGKATSYSANTSIIKNLKTDTTPIENANLLEASADGYISLPSGVWHCNAGYRNNQNAASSFVWKKKDGTVLSNQGYGSGNVESLLATIANVSDVPSVAIFQVPKGETWEVAPVLLTNAKIETSYAYVAINQL